MCVLYMHMYGCVVGGKDPQQLRKLILHSYWCQTLYMCCTSDICNLGVVAVTLLRQVCGEKEAHADDSNILSRLHLRLHEALVSVLPA